MRGAAPLRAAARRLAGFVARSSHTAPGIARRSRLASGPGGLQQNVNLFLREPLAGGEPKRTPGILQLTNVPRPLLINAICPWVLCKAKSAPADFEAPGKKREHPLFILASCESVEVDVPGPGHHPKLLRLRRHVEHAF